MAAQQKAEQQQQQKHRQAAIALLEFETGKWQDVIYLPSMTSGLTYYVCGRVHGVIWIVSVKNDRYILSNSRNVAVVGSQSDIVQVLRRIATSPGPCLLASNPAGEAMKVQAGEKHKFAMKMLYEHALLRREALKPPVHALLRPLFIPVNKPRPVTPLNCGFVVEPGVYSISNNYSDYGMNC